MKKILSLVFITTLIIPNLAFASWWNPTTWFNKWSFFQSQDIKVEQKLIDVSEKNIAASSTDVRVSIIATSSAETTLPSSTPKKEKVAPVKKIKTDPAIVDTEVNARVEATLKAKQIQDIQITKQKADEQAKKDALLKAQQEENTALLRQQNDLLKQQLQAQQQIMQNTAPAVQPSPVAVTVSLGERQCVVDKQNLGTTSPQAFYPFLVNTDYKYAIMRGKIIHSDGTESGYNQEWSSPKLPNAFVGILWTQTEGDIVQYKFQAYSNYSSIYGGFSPEGKLGEVSGSITIHTCQ